VFEGDFFGAFGFAGADVGAVTEAFELHSIDHITGADISFGLAVREEAEVADFCGYEEHGGAVWAGGDAGAATDTGGCVEGFIGDGFGYGYGVGFGCGAGVDADVAACLYDAFEGGTVDDEVFDDGEGGGAEGFDPDGIAVFEVAHVELAGGGAGEGAVWFAVNDHAAGAADTFAAVVVEGDGFFFLLEEAFVEDVEHFQEGHVLVGVDMIGFEVPFILRVFLSPDFECQFHCTRILERYL